MRALEAATIEWCRKLRDARRAYLELPNGNRGERALHGELAGASAGFEAAISDLAKARGGDSRDHIIRWARSQAACR